MGIIINGLTDTVTAADGSLNIGGDVTIPGELSYDDVTNIDSVGVVTARNGLNVTGGNVGMGTDNPGAKLEVHSDTIPRINTVFQGSKHFGISVGGSGGGCVLTDGHFMTVNHQPYADRGTDNNLTEKLRINSDGQVLIGTITNPAYTNRRLTVATTSGTTAIEVRSATNGDGRIYFTDSTTSGNVGAYAGKVMYDHTDNYMAFHTGGDDATPGERLRITSEGSVLLTTNGQGDQYSYAMKLGQGAYMNSGTTGPHYGLWVRQLGPRYSQNFGIYSEVEDDVGMFGGAALDGLSSVSGIGVFGGSPISATAYQKAIGVYGKATNVDYNYNSAIGVRGRVETGTTSFINNNGQKSYGGHFVATGKSDVVGVYADAYLAGSPGANQEAIPLLVASDGSEKLRVTSDGYLGINVTSPSTHLHVEQNNAHSSNYYLNSDAAILVDNKNSSGKAVLKLEGEAALVYGGGTNKFFVADRQNERFRINQYGQTIFQGAASPSNGLTGNAAMLVRGKTVDGSSSTVDLNISQGYSTSGSHIEIQEHSNNANALATLVFNHGSLKSMIAASRVVTNTWGTDLRFYTHDDSTTGANQHKTYERMRIDSAGRVGIKNTSPGENLHIDGAFKQDGAASNVQYTQMCFTLPSGTTSTMFTLSNYGSDATAMAVLEYVALYAYGGSSHEAGIKYASTRRTTNNSAWNDIDDIAVDQAGNNSSIRPTLFWDNGVLKISTSSYAQITGTLRLTTRQFDVSRNFNAG